MGTDIFAHVEILTPNNQWLYYSQLSIERMYSLFDEVITRSQKGIPKDATYMTELHYVNRFPDVYNSGYLLPDDIKSLNLWLKDKYDINLRGHILTDDLTLFGNYFYHFEPYDPAYLNIKSYRVIFWFDQKV